MPFDVHLSWDFVMNYLSGSFGGGCIGGTGAVSSSVFGLQGRVQVLQAQLFPVCPVTGQGFWNNFLSKGLKTNQLEVNTDEKTLRRIARLKEPRDLFALPKDKDHDCSQQAARWPTECQVLDERVSHIPYNPSVPEPYNQPTGNELKPRPVGEENGVVVYNYNPVSAVNYSKNKTKNDDSDGSDTDISSSESRGSSPERRQKLLKHRFSKMFNNYRSSSNSNDENDDDDDDDDDDEDEEVLRITNYADKQKQSTAIEHADKSEFKEDDDGIENIWGNSSPYFSASPTKCFIQRIEAQPVPKETSVPLPQSARLEIVNNCSSSNNLPSSSVLQQCEFSCVQNFKSPSSPPPLPQLPPPPQPIALEQPVDHQLKSNIYSTSPLLLPMPTQLGTASFDNNYDLDSNNMFINILSDNNDNCCPLTQFSRSSVGGSKFLTQVHPFQQEEYDGLWFESRFESGNLAKAVKITETYYELYLRPDLYTSRSKQWFYFRVGRTKKDLIYRFSIVNLVKSDSLYNEGMRPLMYSTKNAKTLSEGWRRCGENICYYRNDDENSNEEDEDNWTYTLTFNIQFPNNDDTVYLAHSYPYTYSDLQDYLMAIQKHPIKSKFCKLRLLCRTLAGNNVYYLTVTAPTTDEEVMKKKKAIVVSARVHPSETPSSWMMKGLMDFITSDTAVAKRLRHKFIFKLIPMLNPDGVIVGNTRNSLTGKDLNRQYRTVIRETYPSIWYTKAMIKRLIDECGVAMYCDMHAHSRRQNIFVYGCENRRNPEKKLTEQVFPLMMHKNVADKFSFENCKFKIQRSKEGTGRIVVWMLGVTNSYTIEASFGGSSLGSRKGTHFSTGDYEHMGRAFCETLLDYCDENPNKERLRLKIIQRLLKEGSSADEPLNIPLSDYSSDEGDTSSSSDNEGKADRFTDLEGPCCQPLKAPPCSPEYNAQMRKFRKKKRSKSYILQSRHKRDQRTPLDMPTTDPSSELFFSSDDEIFADGDAGGIFSTLPRSRRYLLQSDLQRKYISGSTNLSYALRMPPELIVTPAKQGTSSGKPLRTPEKQKLAQLLPSGTTEFPPVSGGLNRRTNSWHSLHSTESNNTMQNPRQSEQKEECLFSLRKKLWQCSQEPKCLGERPRPLSWGIPPIQAEKKEKNKLQGEQEAFFTECSQKLKAWQQETSSENPHRKLKVNVVNTEFRGETSGMLTNRGKKITKNSSKVDFELKNRNKKISFTKISESSRIIGCLSKNNNPQSAASVVRKPHGQYIFSSTTMTTLTPLTTSSLQRPSTNKFKTSGLVATAVQPGKKAKLKCSLINLHKPNTRTPLTNPMPSQIENEKSYARKVKTKLKKKKSSSSSVKSSK